MTILPTINDAVVLRLLKQALRVLSDRLLTIIVFLSAVGAGSYAMYAPDYHRDAICAFFGILYCITLNRERGHHELPVPREAAHSVESSESGFNG